MMQQDLKSRVAWQLRQLIYEGKFAPGDRLAENPLSEKLGASRTPIRAALVSLEKEGLIAATPGGGFVVRAVTVDQINHALDVRGALEGLAARTIADEGLSRSARKLLQECLDVGEEMVAAAFSKPDMQSRYATMNEKFHTTIVHEAKNEAILRALAANEGIPFTAPKATIITVPDPKSLLSVLIISHNQHKSIVEAIDEGDGTRAEFLMREHTNISKTTLKKLRDMDPKYRKKISGLHLVA